MDGRLKRLLAGGVLCSMLGCGYLRDKTPKPPLGSGEPPFAMTDKPIVEDRHAKNDGPLRVETLIAVANVRVQAAADEGRSTQEREELANKARLVYQQALAREPKNYEALLGMARMYAVVRDKEKCVEWYQRATAAYPSKGEVWYEMGKTLGSYFKDRDGAVACLHTATKLTPENRAYRTELGFTLAWAGRYDEGYAWLSRTMPEVKARYNIAGIMEHNGQTDHAKMWLALALQADPNHEPSKQMMAALNGGGRDKQMDSPIQSVNHEQWSTLTVGTNPAASMEATNPQRTVKPAAPNQSSDPMPLNTNRPNPVTPPLLPSSDWQR